ncbi:MAG TPA: LysR family transcriptional regulator [Candidatus Polarisedimenticolaceae bacterium]
MPLPDPRTDAPALRAFVATARTGSVVRAAAELGRTQPSLSARLSALERAWDTKLFRRGARGMTLTPEGARLLPLAEAALRSLEALDVAAGVPVSGPGEIRVGAGDALGRELLPRVLAELLSRERALGVRLLEGPTPRLLQALRDGEIDVALVARGPAAPGIPGLAFEPLLESPIDLLVPAARRLPRGPRTLEDLAAERFVSLQPGSEFRRHVERAFEAEGIPFRPTVEVGNLSLVRRFVAAGVGVALVPAIAFDSEGKGAPVRRARIAGVPPIRYARAIREGVPLGEGTLRFLGLLAQPRTATSPPSP